MGFFSSIYKATNTLNKSKVIEKKSEFEKNKEYIDNLREKIQLDQEVMGFEKNVSKVLVKGSDLLIEGIGEKLEIEVLDDFLIFMKSKKLSSNEVIALLKGLKNRGHKSTKIISKYLNIGLKEDELKELKKIVKEEVPRGISL